MPTALDTAVSTVLDKFRGHFGFHLHHYPQLTPEYVLNSPDYLCRQDVTVHFLFQNEPWPEQERPDFQDMRRWLMAEGVMLVEYPTKTDPGYLVAPIIPVPIATAYHATPRKNLEAIEKEGLLPGDSAKGRASTGHRFDCQGNIFVCPKLGTPQDAGQQCTFSSHWWRDHLSSKNGDSDWVILRLDGLDALPGLVTNRDFLGESGVILSGVDRIPATHVTVEWPCA